MASLKTTGPNVEPPDYELLLTTSMSRTLQASAGRSRECVLSLLRIVGTAPGVRATEQELQIRCAARKMAQMNRR
jgi:hypothetical protein